MAEDNDNELGEDSGGEGILEEAKEAFETAINAEHDNRENAADDLRFARLGEQWPDDVRKQREADQRPILTINRLPAFIRQVVNDARQNKPSIKVHPADSGADVETAEIMNGLIRNIEYTSDAEIAYDTATECAVSMGWGYFKIDADFAHDDTFDMDLKICRVSNPFSIYGDPFSTAADSSDWNSAFETEWLTEDEFKSQYPDVEPSSWDNIEHREHWVNEDQYLVARWWQRKEVTRTILLLSDGRTMDKATAEEIVPEVELSRLDMLSLGYDPETAEPIAPVTVKKERQAKSWEVKRHTLVASKVVKSEVWPGKYIPIIPVYGDEMTDEKGVRHLRSLIRDAKDPQRMFNYWRTTATELVALAPRAPWIGPKGSFNSDGKRWATANTESHPFLEYDVVAGQAPQRQPLDSGPAGGALQEAMNASDDIKSSIGMYDSSLGARSNETSGRAILARQREGDVSTFHFQDNMSRAIRHAGRILIDLIPHFYDKERIIRVMGEDGKPENVPLKQPVPKKDENGQPIMRPAMGPNGQPMPGPDGKPAMQPETRIFDLAAGKYDLTVTTGPSYSTQREEAREQMVNMAQAFPPLMQIAGDLIAQNMDWPGADEIAKRLKTMLPPQLNGGLPPEVQQMIEAGKAQINSQGQMIQQMQAYINKLEADKAVDNRKVDIDQFEAETDRIEAFQKMQDAKYHQTDVPDAGGQYGDFKGLMELAKVGQIKAQTEQTRMRTMKEALQQPVQQSVPIPGPQRGF
ncbi:portal protein [Aurantimonas coralicida]|uniref:portal protein n=1 Tax=Aurantimonas coralicida TaxID=182270 RepID=UPI001E2EB568|nr:portal protein [Aurantimonas coralicida]MCD1644153.1 hypothetical protein [Aurantimonas coralicida]